MNEHLPRAGAKPSPLDGWFESAADDRSEVLPIRRIGIVGAGVMGSGIAHWLATKGFAVVLRDASPERTESGMQTIRGLLGGAVGKRQISEGDAAAAIERIVATETWDEFEACDLVIEAVLEDAALKRALFSELGRIVRPDALLASNTSALPIEEIAGHVPHPERTLGLHFFNPVRRMELVEMILGRSTTREVAARALAFVTAIGKTPVVCRSSPGFLMTRVLFFYLNAAVSRWEAGVPTGEMDAAMRAFGWPMGPLRLIDEVGVDVTDFIFGELERYFPGRFVRAKATSRLIAAGLKGRKNGASRGFYRYETREPEANDAEVRPLVEGRRSPSDTFAACAITEHLMRTMVEEAERCLAEGVVRSADEIDFAFRSGAGFPAERGGLLRWARAGGLGAIART